MSAMAQHKIGEPLRFDFRLVVDNDAFTGDLTRDQYYSSGIYAAMRMLADSSRNSRNVLSWQFNHRIYTPSLLSWSSINDFDRPYAGQMSVTVGHERYFFKNGYLKTAVELGWMGPGVKMGDQQSTWHELFNMQEPKGWRWQINDTPIANLKAVYARSLFYAENAELVMESQVAAGTVFNYVRQELLFRFGHLAPLRQSALYSGTLGRIREMKSPESIEGFFFYAPALEYVVYNATLEGNFIGEPSPFTVSARPWVVQHKFGMLWSWPRFDFGFTYYIRTPENPEATRHGYAAIRMNQRF